MAGSRRLSHPRCRSALLHRRFLDSGDDRRDPGVAGVDFSGRSISVLPQKGIERQKNDRVWRSGNVQGAPSR
jgi:hypothetical protein